MFATYHMEKAGNINRTTVHDVSCHTNILFFSQYSEGTCDKTVVLFALQHNKWTVEPTTRNRSLTNSTLHMNVSNGLWIWIQNTYAPFLIHVASKKHQKHILHFCSWECNVSTENGIWTINLYDHFILYSARV